MADEPTTKGEREPESTDLPLWFRVIVIGFLVAFLAVHILIDAARTDYEGAATSLMLGGIVGTALGLNEFLRGRGGSQ